MGRTVILKLIYTFIQIICIQRVFRPSEITFISTDLPLRKNKSYYN